MIERKKDQKQKVPEVKTFAVPFILGEVKENISINLNTPSKISKEQIINQAFKFHSEGNIPEAVKYYQLFINQGLEDYRVFSNYGIILKGFGKLKEAEISYRKAIELHPDFADAYLNLGDLLRDLSNLEEAELYTRKAIKINPDFADANSNLGIILKDLGNLKEAELYTRKAIKINPDLADSHSNLGIILNNIGKSQEAELSIRKAIKLNPNLADAHLTLGNILRDLGKLEEAEISQRKAIELKPDFAEAYSNLASLLLQRMKFKEGWDYYEWRWKVHDKDNYIGEKLVTSKPEWSLISKGRVLLWGEQGIGDQILFTSLIPELVQKVDKLIVKVDKRLIPLLQRSFDKNIIYFDQNDFISEDKYDFQIAMGSLPRLLITNKESLTKSNKTYLKVDDKKSHNFRKQLRNLKFEKIIGISWKSMSKINKDKSLSLEEFILGIHSPSFCFVNLQYGDTTDEIINLKKKYDINIIDIDEVDTFNDIDDLASLINACDQIVTIENLISDLAGAIGINSLILLNNKSHWRFGQTNDYSYWFPLQKLFRKNQSQTWDNTLNQIQKDLISENNKIHTSI
ncbi:tetratricopeptide repeat protein [Prochlorococcus marinus]|uniref:tetratricopeptide repeat protein n=1 Tax=Prochlorococcus marinus TaxID=1219 RepID=UPI0022B33E89|nr:tetratricopeptide repeat protein [Prochlorococcus marinus]